MWRKKKDFSFVCLNLNNLFCYIQLYRLQICEFCVLMYICPPKKKKGSWINEGREKKTVKKKDISNKFSNVDVSYASCM